MGGAGDADCDDIPPPPVSGPIEYTFADGYHHRDHLGNLRITTDAAGWPATPDARHD